MKLIVTFVLLAISPIILANDYVCTHGSSERTINVAYSQKNSSVPCQVVYEKKDEGTVQYPWSANNLVGYCEEKATYLAERLGGFGWQCVSPVAEAKAEAEE